MEQNNQAYLGLRQALETAVEAMDPEIRAHSLRTGQRMAVSYTHLDVYKRQVLRSPLPRQLKPQAKTPQA